MGRQAQADGSMRTGRWHHGTEGTCETDGIEAEGPRS